MAEASEIRFHCKFPLMRHFLAHTARLSGEFSRNRPTVLNTPSENHAASLCGDFGAGENTDRIASTEWAFLIETAPCTNCLAHHRGAFAWPRGAAPAIVFGWTCPAFSSGPFGPLGKQIPVASPVRVSFSIAPSADGLGPVCDRVGPLLQDRTTGRPQKATKKGCGALS